MTNTECRRFLKEDTDQYDKEIMCFNTTDLTLMSFDGTGLGYDQIRSFIESIGQNAYKVNKSSLSQCLVNNKLLSMKRSVV